jgi:hypothetical protein
LRKVEGSILMLGWTSYSGEQLYSKTKEGIEYIIAQPFKNGRIYRFDERVVYVYQPNGSSYYLTRRCKLDRQKYVFPNIKEAKEACERYNRLLVLQ